MSTLPVLVVAAAILITLPIVVDRWARRRASSTALVALAFATLSALMLLPVAIAVCFGIVGARSPAGAGSAALLLAAAALVLFSAGRATRTWLRLRRQCRNIQAAAASLRSESAGTVAIVPGREPKAFVAGNTLVVTHALLQVLPPHQADGVLAHERAHLRGGHPRLAHLAAALHKGLWGLPHARRAETRLRHELEVLADADAAAQVGDAGVLAEAILALGCTDSGHPPVVDSADLSDRIARLNRPTGSTARADAVVVATTITVAAAGVIALCAAFHVQLLAIGVAICAVAVLTYLASIRPLLRRDRRVDFTNELFASTNL